MFFLKHQSLHLGFDFYHKATFTALYFQACFSFVRLGQIFSYFTADVIEVLEILHIMSYIFGDRLSSGFITFLHTIVFLICIGE